MDKSFNINSQPVEVFISYSHKDTAYKEELEKHLSILKRQNIITTWDYNMLNPTDEWNDEIVKHLNSANIILLLISEDFINSNYCYNVEMKRAIEKHEKGQACVIPVIIRPCMWANTPFAKLQALPEGARPVNCECQADFSQVW